DLLRAGREFAERNGTEPWLFIFREAWLRTTALDFDGARRLSDELMKTAPEYWRGQPGTIAKVGAGFVELAQQHYEAAAEKFRQVLNREITRKFFLHWYWRMNAQFGLSNVWLASGKLAAARTEADRFLASAASTADPNLQALAWELQARVAMAENDWAS